ncbi:MAG TPA: hypothetical protein VKB75_05285, partial [Jatrophihabitans sp.]|nr:hypothetical protein [Jatrophihabitans sp.]
RDGLDPRPPDKRIGAKAWLLVQIIAAAPLDLWPEVLGGPPADLVALPVADDFVVDVHAGWRIAAARQRNAEWARALLRVDADVPPHRAWTSDEALAALLDDDERQARAAAMLAQDVLRPGTAEAALQGCPVPWNRPLVSAVLAFVARAVRSGAPAAIGGLLPIAARGLPVDGALDPVAEFRRLADEAPEMTVLPTALRRAANVLDLRRRFLEELH